jgi:hypothetical protein
VCLRFEREIWRQSERMANFPESFPRRLPSRLLKTDLHAVKGKLIYNYGLQKVK